MSDQNNQGGSGRKPEYVAFNVTNDQNGKGFFNRIGAAWQHKDGQGFDVKLDSVPVDGRITLREQRDQQMQRFQQQGQAMHQKDAPEHGKAMNQTYEQER